MGGAIRQLESHRADFLRKKPVMSNGDFDGEMAPFLHDAWITCLLEPPVPELYNTDGERILCTRVRFDVLDRRALEAALDGAPDLERVYKLEAVSGRGFPVDGRSGAGGRSRSSDPVGRCDGHAPGSRLPPCYADTVRRSLESLPVRVRLALAEYRKRLSERFGTGLLDLRLFGSRARGEAHADSDVDLLVVLEHAAWRDRVAAIDIAADVGLEHGLLLSPTVFDRPSWDRFRAQRRPLACEVERDGISL